MNPFPLNRLRARVAPLVLLCAVANAFAQTTTPPPAVGGVLPPSSATLTPGPAAQAAAPLTHEQLETLLGPIALYPDALIALILPAATSPSDVVLAARYLAAKGDPAQVDQQPWDESVRSLAHYPEVITWMDENLAWTKQLGDAFVAQPADVMQAVQRLRARARAAGTLTDTPQQKVVVEGEILLIEPARPDVIYVPRYDPDVVYLTRSPGWSEPFLSFGVGFAAGAWLTYDCDWPGRTIWVGDWRRQPRTVWVRPAFPNRPLRPGIPLPVARPWHPPEHRLPPAPRMIGPRPSVVVVYPRPMPGTPPRPPGFNYPTRHFEPLPPPRVIRAATPGMSGFTPPPVVMPPPTTIGAPPPAPDRRRERERGGDPSPDRPRSDSRRIPPTPGTPAATVPPPPVTPAPGTVPPGPTMTPRPERFDRPDRADRADRAERANRPERPDGPRREPRASTAPPAPTPPPVAPAKPTGEPGDAQPRD